MSDGTHIEWTDATWNPLRARVLNPIRTETEGQIEVGWHCERVSPGCQHCYAETINEKRFGTGLPYNRKSRDMVSVELDEKALLQPLHWRRPRKVFVCSMTDLFGEWVPDEVIDRVFAVMALSPQHTFQVLTKRPERMRAYVADRGKHGFEYSAAGRIVDVIIDDKSPAFSLIHGDPSYVVKYFDWEHQEGEPWWPLPNVGLGTSVEDQPRANERIGHLLATPAAVRFLSCEPLLGAVDLAHIDTMDPDEDPGFSALVCGPDDEGTIDTVIDWVIVGGESGPGARPCDIGWIRGIVGQCQAAGTAVFVKQLGAKPFTSNAGLPWADEHPVTWYRYKDRKGGDMAEWPKDLRVREFPNA